MLLFLLSVTLVESGGTYRGSPTSRWKCALRFPPRGLYTRYDRDDVPFKTFRALFIYLFVPPFSPRQVRAAVDGFRT